MLGLAWFLLKFLLSSRRGLILLGLLLVLGGVVTGIASHSVTYRNGTRGTVAHYLSGDSAHIGYLQMGNSSDLYYVNENEFTPTINENGTQTLGRGSSISYVYTPDETEQIDETATDTGAHLQGTAFRVVQLTLYDQNGQNPEVFTSSDYAQNPQGYYQNNWPGGMSLLVLGFLVTGSALFWPKRYTKSTKSAQYPQQMNFSCTDCGANWSRGQWSVGCRQCGGAALEIACPLCQGRCGSKWKRAVVDSRDYRQAHWGGVCGFRSFSRSPTKLQ